LAGSYRLLLALVEGPVIKNSSKSRGTLVSILVPLLALIYGFGGGVASSPFGFLKKLSIDPWLMGYCFEPAFYFIFIMI
jgi:hypothetical protein